MNPQGTPDPGSDERLRGLLKEGFPDTPLPPGFQQAVFRRIARASDPAPTGIARWMEWLRVPRIRPAYAFAIVALVMTTSGLVGGFGNDPGDHESMRHRYLASVSPIHRTVRPGP